MLSLQELQFAARFPFSSTAKQIAKMQKIDIENIPNELLERASLRIIKSFQKNPYTIKILTDKHLLISEIVAFYIAKVLTALLGYSAVANFSNNIYKTTFANLQDISQKIALDLAQDLNIPVVADRDTYSVPVEEFCRVSFLHRSLSLKLQNLKNGSVFLSYNNFAKFLAAFSQLLLQKEIEQTDLNSVPKNLKEYAKKLKEKIYAEQKLEISGRVSIAAFPPCIRTLYNSALAGENLPHFSRYALATFLVAIKMPAQQIVSVFKNTPNFKEKTTRYQVERILKKGYAPYGCKKMQSLMLCVANCNVKSPLQFYKKELKK